MGGRASLIMVIGFAIIFGYINLNMAKLTSSGIENMVGYNQIAASRNMVNAGANVGLAMLSKQNYPHNNRILASKNYTGAPFSDGGYVVRIDSFSTPEPYLLMTSSSHCTTYVFEDQDRTKPVILRDTILIRFASGKEVHYNEYAWLSDQEGNVFFTQEDTLFGTVHSNSNIHIDKNPVFWKLVTTSGRFDPKNNKGEFWGNKEAGVAEVPFPNDLSELKNTATNIPGTRDKTLYVELKPGTAGDNDGYAIICTTSFSSTNKVDSIKLSDFSNNVIYTTLDIHVKGSLDGRLSIAAGNNIYLEGNTTYERPPDAYNEDPGLLQKPPILTLSQNFTKDMLGLVAKNDINIPSTYHGDIAIDGALFAENGSFQAANWNASSEGRINIRGSVCQKTRGPVGQTNGKGYKKSYRYDPRFALADDPDMHPPAFPSYFKGTTLHITNWWESPRIPLNVQNYY